MAKSTKLYNDEFKQQNKEQYAREDPHLSWVFRPHTITALFLCFGLLIYFAFSREGASYVSNVKIGLISSCGIFLLFSMFQMRDGLFVRPHPAFWRVIMGLGVIYLLCLVFLLFQNVDDARQLLTHFDPKLGVPLPERSYAEDCRLYVPEFSDPYRNLQHALEDEFVIAHLLGWWAKMLVIRDAYMCWTLSILFEVMELSFEALLPNFAECWWDHIILDILVCNFLGIVLGSLTCRYFQMKEYNWAGAPRTSEGSLESVTAFSQYLPLPKSFETYHWGVLSCPKRFCYVIGLIVCFEIVELNAFFLKFVLWIPPPHFINVSRLVLWGFLGLPALREFYKFVTDSTCKKFGPMVWLSLAIAGVELLISIKFGAGMFPDPIPDVVIYGWIIFIVLLVIWAVCFFTFRTPETKKPENWKEQKKLK